jgi:glycosyltransferase involved in cell wall biosynthesis
MREVNNNGVMPLVSIGIPTFNANHKIGAALISILDQNYPNLEIIVSDNCSTDATEKNLTSISSSDSRIKYFRQSENIGILPNFEFVFKQSRGEYFMWLADDDTLEPGIIEKYVIFLMDNPEYSLVSGGIKYWDNNHLTHVEKNFTIKHESPIKRVLTYYFKVIYGGMFHGMMRTVLAKKIQIRNILAADWHLVAEMAYMGKIKNLKITGYNKQLGGSSRNFRDYANNIGASSFAGHFPFLQISFDTFSEIMYKSSVYSEISFLNRFLFSAAAMLAILSNHYIMLYPKILGGKIKRLFLGKKVELT